MDDKTRGQNLAAIRKCTYDPHTLLPLTQLDVAQGTGYSLRQIENLEQGLLKHIDPDMLVAVAKKLCLTTLEFEALLALLPGVRRRDAVRIEQSPQQLLNQEFERLAHKRLPAILYDPFFHVLAVNRVGTALHGVTGAQLDAMLQEQGHVNFLHFIFHPQSPLRVSFREIWPLFVKLNLHQYRVMTLPYRYTGYFNRQFEAFRRGKDFLRYWIETQGEDFCTQTKVYDYYHPQLRTRLRYETEMSAIQTTCGKLYRATLQPLDASTVDAFAQLFDQTGPGIKRLTPWPHDALLPKKGEGGGKFRTTAPATLAIARPAAELPRI